ncbi:hypothetical protein BKA65DRAFT_547700 [Rhexocercosporidium sp. MPI-PUGE-AT-0058]|nr:hypothetical protein BKA65DRAFT_547700 [Rhexocercosporidium sp. MPI-PUGE-AT-0058]
MAALVQSYSQQSGTITMLQTRPSSASGILQNASQAQSHHQYPANPQQMKRNSVHGMSNGMGITNYRGHTPVAPIAPYAFTSTPSLATPGQRQGPHLRPDQRTISAPGGMAHHAESGQNRSRYPAPLSVSTTSSSSSSNLSSLSHRSGAKDDSAITGTARVVSGAARPHSIVMNSNNGSLAPPTMSAPAKPSPDRYRRPNNRRTESGSSQQPSTPTGSSMPNVMQFYGNSAQQPSLPTISPQSFSLQMPQFSKPTTGFTSGATSADDMALNRNTSQEAIKRYRRRSIHTIDAADYNGVSGGLLQQGSRQVSSANGRIDQQQQHPLRSSPVGVIRPGSSHGRNGSSESVNSARSAARGHNSRPSSATKREASASMAAPSNPAPSSSQTPAANTITDHTTAKQDVPRLVNIPPRASSTDAAKRIANPSPLSKPMTMSPESSVSKDSFASAVQAALQQQPAKPTYAQAAGGSASPAAQQLAALNDKEGKKSKTSRLRRAFSFGSAAELRRASAENSAANNAVERSQQRKDKYQEEQDAEQIRIAQQQEAGGIGSGIYSGQGNIFTGSTDNLSISSTASSASIMIRKMGKGMKKSTRSLVGLFRPKSVIGVPAADGPLPQASQAQVSMVTVEAEREKVNVNADPHDQAGGGTGFPRLERNSLDAANATATITERLGSASTENSTARRSIVGGEKERAEVLAAVKKGILKRTGTESGNSSPVIRPLDPKAANFQLPQIPHVNDSPNSSAPSTPNDEQQVHRKNGSVTLGGEDYFMSALRFRGDSKSMPGTPQGTATKRNATFSPRIQFHDTWPSGEYDRRGEIATCNRLTPMLAQQIKEEINNFKMEMVVHENSKIYTHFF